MSSESSEPARFPFLRLHASPTKRPLLWLFLENLHAPDNGGFRYPALLDTGADCSVVPHALCKELGHVFDAGTSPSTTGGIGAGRLRTFRHATRATVLGTPASGAVPGVEAAVFFPIELSLGFVEQDIPFILLGQSDFLNCFEYTQNRPEGWFSLRRL